MRPNVDLRQEKLFGVDPNNSEDFMANYNEYKNSYINDNIKHNSEIDAEYEDYFQQIKDKALVDKFAQKIDIGSEIEKNITKMLTDKGYLFKKDGETYDSKIIKNLEKIVKKVNEIKDDTRNIDLLENINEAIQDVNEYEDVENISSQLEDEEEDLSKEITLNSEDAFNKVRYNEYQASSKKTAILEELKLLNYDTSKYEHGYTFNAIIDNIRQEVREKKGLPPGSKISIGDVADLHGRGLEKRIEMIKNAQNIGLRI